jgi:hypothetical protein
MSKQPDGRISFGMEDVQMALSRPIGVMGSSNTSPDLRLLLSGEPIRVS